MTVLFVAILIALVFLVGAVVLASRNERHRLIANAPPGALVGAGDSTAEAQAKLAQYRATLEAARILQVLLVRDDAVYFLNDQERRDITAWLEAFYYGRRPS